MQKRYQRQIQKYKKLFQQEEIQLLEKHEHTFKMVYLLGLFDRFEILRK